jgi:signal transduction histidine kinase
MYINHQPIIILAVAMLWAPLMLHAQQTTCKDTAEHHRLQDAMWASCSQDDPTVVYAACWAYQEHAMKDNDNEAFYNAWICGIMYNLNRMNIHDAYHITQTMKEDLDRHKYTTGEEQFLAPKMLGHVYNTCGNIPGAQEQFKEAIRLIKGTRYEADGLGFLYLGLAHIQLNNDPDESLYWVEKDLEELSRHQDQANYYRGLADAYAIKAIVKFKKHCYDEFNQCYELSMKAGRENPLSNSDIFLPYAHIYKMLLDGKTKEALTAADQLPNKKEQYLMKCDIYRYTGDTEKAFITQRELMRARDSITGVMIAENIQKQEHDLEMMKSQQEASHRMNILLTFGVVLGLIVIILLHRILFIRRNFSKRLLAKNEELNAANERVTAADRMKTEFIRNVSHEIRTPLNIINGFTQVLTDETNAFETQERQYIAGTISDNTKQITSIVNKMLVLANEDTKDLLKAVEEMDVSDICQHALHAMPSIGSKPIDVIFDDQIHDDIKIIRTNCDSLSLMLGNLLENAVKFTDEGQIRLILSHDKTHFHFTVEDTGCGIPADKVGTIFERFTKVDAFKEGLGLGLAYCYETAQKLGGGLRLDRTSEQGTSFTLSLPIKLNT